MYINWSRSPLVILKVQNGKELQNFKLGLHFSSCEIVTCPAPQKSLLLSRYISELLFLLAALKKYSMVFNVSLSSSTCNACMVHVYIHALLQSKIHVGWAWLGNVCEFDVLRETNKNLCHFFASAHDIPE